MLREDIPHGELSFMRMEHAILSLAKGLMLKYPEWTEQEAAVLESHLQALLTIAVEFHQARGRRESRRSAVSAAGNSIEAAQLSQSISATVQLMQQQLQTNRVLDGRLDDQLDMIVRLYNPQQQQDVSSSAATEMREDGEMLTGMEDLAYITQLSVSNPVLFKGKKLNIQSKSKGASRHQTASSPAVSHRIRVRVGNTTYEK